MKVKIKKKKKLVNAHVLRREDNWMNCVLFT